jgi:hypothetical protein
MKSMRQRDPRTIAVFGGTIVLIALAFALLSRSAIELGAATRPQASIEPAKVAKPPAAGDPSDAPPRKAAADGTAPQPPAGEKAPSGVADAEQGEGLDRAAALSLAAHAADDYRKRAQYPKWSQPLEEGEDPILRDRTVSPVTARGQDGHTTLTVFPDRVAFEWPDRVLLYAFLTIHGERVAAKDMRGQILTEALQPVADLVYSDEGAGADAAPGDRVYSAAFQPPVDRTPALSESFMVRVFAITPEDDEIVGVTGFQYSSPDAQLTGAYRDRPADGGLTVEAEVEVRNPGRFHIEASLYDRNGQRPVAWAQDAAELPPGRHWMPLRYFGRVLHERGIDGPYVLRFVALSTVTQMPNAKNRLVENAFVTAPYDAAQFSDAPFDDPDLLDAARRVEQDLQAGNLEGNG